MLFCTDCLIVGEILGAPLLKLLNRTWNRGRTRLDIWILVLLCFFNVFDSFLLAEWIALNVECYFDTVVLRLFFNLLSESLLGASLTWKWTSSSKKERPSPAWSTCWTSVTSPARLRCGACSQQSWRKVYAIYKHAQKWALLNKCSRGLIELTTWLQVQFHSVYDSNWISLCKISRKNLISDRNLTLRSIKQLYCCFFSFSDLLVDMLGVLASYNLTVRELKLFFSKLQGQKGRWVKENKTETVFCIVAYIFAVVHKLKDCLITFIMNKL